VRYLLPLFCLLLSGGSAYAPQDQDAQEQPPGDPKERARAAKELGKKGSGAIPQLQTYLSDPDLEVRLEAVKAIVAIGTRHSIDPLIQATRDNDAEIQIRATDGLVNFYLPGYVETGLTASLKRAGNVVKSKFTDTTDQVIDPYVEVRPDVIAALGALARGGVSMESRANAARAIGILRGKAAIPDLLAALRSKDDAVLFESLIALQKIHDPSAAQGITFLLRDPKEKVQIAALETTGMLLNREALPDLVKALDQARSVKVRRAALTAIAMMPDESVRPVLKRYFDDRDDGLRAAAAEGYGRLKNPADLPALEQAFNDERSTNVRLSLAFALACLGKTELSQFSPLQYLIDKLNSRAYRGVCETFLAELSRESVPVRRTLEMAAPKGTKDEKIYIARILARTGDKDSIPVLETLQKDIEPEVAQEGVRALRNLRARIQ